MKILIPVFGFGKHGGYRVLSNLANSWIEMGHEVTFISVSDSIEPYYPTLANIVWVDEHGFASSNHVLNYKRTFRYGRDMYSLLKGLNAMKTENYDVVLANQSHTTFPVMLSHIKSLKAYYIQADEVETQRILGGWKNWILSSISKLSYSLNLFRIVNSPLYLDYKYIKAEEFVLPGLDFNLFYPKEQGVDDFKNRTIRIGCIGRIAPHKGTQDVIDAFSILKKECIDVKLFVAFGDEVLNEIPNVSVCIPSNDSELADFYRSLDILIAPGTIQLGAVHYPVIEAMACGTPVITTGYFPADNTNSWIVSINNPLHIAETVKYILTDGAVAEKTHKAIADVQHMDWHNSSSKMINCFVRELHKRHI